MTRIAHSAGVTPADVGPPPTRLKSAGATPEMTPEDAARQPRRANDPDRLRWYNTPFARRLDLLKAGDGPEWITNTEQRIDWLTKRIFGEPQGELNPDTAPKEADRSDHIAGLSASSTEITPAGAPTVPTPLRLNAAMLAERLRAGLATPLPDLDIEPTD